MSGTGTGLGHFLSDLVLVECPCECVVGGLDGDVSDERDAHVGVRLQAEGDDRDDDEEHRHHASHLEVGGRKRVDKSDIFQGFILMDWSLRTIYRVTMVGWHKHSIQDQCNNHTGPESRVRAKEPWSLCQ